MKKKLLFIMGSLENGGGERSLLNLLHLLDYQKYEVEVILFKERGLFFEQLPQEVKLLSDLKVLHFMYDDSLIHAFDWRHPYLSFIHIFGTLFSKAVSKSGFHKGQYRWTHFYRNVIPMLENTYDVAISYLEGETTYYLVDKVQAKRKIAWVHTDYSKIKTDTQIDLKYFNNVDKIVSISDTCVKTLQEMFPEVKDRIVELPNLTDTKLIYDLANQFYPEEYKRDELKFISVGRLIQLKGFDLAIQAASILKKKGIKFTWFVLGDGELREELKKFAVEQQVSDCFKFLGARENPYTYMLHADILVQPSRYEGKSIVLDEAKILGKPIVVTNYDTVKDQILDNKEGVIVSITPQGIAEGLEKLILDVAFRDKIEQYLSSHVYGNQGEVKKYMDLMDET